jgi:hypothetical protein
MKQKIYTITTLFILLSATFGQTVFAQTAKKQTKVLTQDEIDKRDVTKFVDKFMSNLEKTQDIAKTPKHFFVEDYTERFADNYEFDDDEFVKMMKNLSLAEKSELFSNLITFWYLMFYCGSVNDKNGNGNLDEIFPDKYFRAKKSNSFFQSFASDDYARNNFNNESDVRLSIKDGRTFINFTRKYIASRPKSWKAKRKMVFANMTKNIDRFESKKCKDKNCEGFPENTKIIKVAKFPLTFQLVQINGKFKIIKVGILID